MVEFEQRLDVEFGDCALFDKNGYGPELALWRVIYQRIGATGPRSVGLEIEGTCLASFDPVTARTLAHALLRAAEGIER